jgi:hypothetical protein
MARPKEEKKQVDPSQELTEDTISKILDKTAQLVKELRSFKEKEREGAKGEQGRNQRSLFANSLRIKDSKILNEGKRCNEDIADDQDGES